MNLRRKTSLTLPSIQLPRLIIIIAIYPTPQIDNYLNHHLQTIRQQYLTIHRHTTVSRPFSALQMCFSVQKRRTIEINSQTGEIKALKCLRKRNDTFHYCKAQIFTSSLTSKSMLGLQYNKPHHHHPQTSTSVVEPYNSVLTTHAAMEFSDVTFLVDNDAVFGICKDKLEVKLFLFIVDNV